MPVRPAQLVRRLGHARAAQVLVAGGLFIGIALAAATAWFLVATRHDAIADVVREMRNDALMLADQEDRLLQSQEQIQLALVGHIRELGVNSPEDFERRMGTEEVHRELTARIVGRSYLIGLWLSDRRGRLLNTSVAWPPPAIEDGDRDFIRGLAAADLPGTFISAPSRSKVTGNWNIYFSRRVESADGGLIGFVVSAIEMDYFEHFYAQLPLTGGGSFALFRRDGLLMARYPHVDPQVGKSFAASMNFGDMLASLDRSGVTRVKSQFDGKDRLIVPHAMAHFPFIVTVSDTMESILAAWGEDARMLSAATVLLEIVIAGTLLLAIRYQRGQARLQAAETGRARAETSLAVAEERERAAHALDAQQRRFATALNNMLQGLLMVSHTGHLLVVNRRFHELFGLPPDTLVPGITYQQLTARIVELGAVPADAMRQVQARRIELIASNECATTMWDLPDGRSFNVTHQPMEEGWLTTFEDITDRREAEARMAHLAHHDALTELPNRVLFRQQLEEALAHARRGRPLALLCLDLDQFKAVNDTLGHPTGDALLRAVAERLLQQTRDTDSVARLGGDEFAIVQWPTEKPIEATRFAERLIQLMATPFDVAGHRIVIGTSIGIAYAPQDGIDADHLLRCADLALYRAKVDGRGVCRLFHAEMDAQMQARRLLELDLRLALPEGQFEVFYQPQIDLAAAAVTGFEALLRWRHPGRGLVSPAQFIPLAEEIGLIVPIGEWVLRQACAAAATWPGTMRVAVNLSPLQFKHGNLVSVVAAALRWADLAPDRLELEITETVMLQDTDATLATLNGLREIGVCIAMDDFGTGYSSLSYLRRFPFDRIKIDQSFIRDLCSKPDCSAIVRAVAALSRELGMATTAEGVETHEQLEALRRAGCTDVQGYLFSPAVPGGDVAALLRRIDASLRPAEVPAERETVG